MKLIKTASGKKKLRMSKKDWKKIGKQAGWMKKSQIDPVWQGEDGFLKPVTYEYFINLDERGEFYADVRNSVGSTVFEIKGFDIFEDGFMKHKDDIDGLRKHLISLGIMNEKQGLVKGN